MTQKPNFPPKNARNPKCEILLFNPVIQTAPA